ncbi:PIG-L family deacetylase [Mucilaginibacter arboris]|uniref:LmbE family protein n=1 Tax=Mucilaginibacter arboris TaxID=2682090 RepID=A0A7K1SS19_9SPHI|nr:PIG-L family deacetylase [Mucilaginibacter arboris]MVN20116.1 LmbE family protein [Mucilaginibacter arboris]
MKRFYILLLFLWCKSSIYAQTSPPADRVSIEQELKKLPVLGSVLYVAAHPDDENTRLLAYLAQEKHYRTGYLALTRGDGGQNLIGNEQGELLGLIRTQELLAARHVDGAEQFFTRAKDFGFSKGPDETLKIWDREKILGDVVWVIRKFRPDVMICRFPTTGEGGHGHHTASAILAQEAFAAAADPKRFPEQLQFVQPWQAKRLLWNTFNFGGNDTTNPDQFKIDVGVYNTLLGKGYGEIAADSRSNHKSQGFGTAKQRGTSYEFFKTILGDAPRTDLMDGVNTTWKRVQGGDEINIRINDLVKSFNPTEPAKSLPLLMDIYASVQKLSDAYWKTQKLKELDLLIPACAGLWLESYAVNPTYAVGDSISIRNQVIDRSGINIKLVATEAGDQKNTFNTLLPANQMLGLDSKTIAKKITQPYWLDGPQIHEMYPVAEQQLVGYPENPDPVTVKWQFVIYGHLITLQRQLMYKYVNPVRGEVYQPLEITPPVTANLDQEVYIFNNNQPKQITVKLKSFTNSNGSISLKVPAGWKVAPANASFTGKKKGDEWGAVFTVTSGISKNETDTIQAITQVNGKTYTQGIHQISYEHIPNITFFPPAEAKLVNVDLKTNGKRIAYVPGAGDLVSEALQQVGYQVNTLTENEILTGNLSVYDAIIIGVRAFNINNRLTVEQPKLLEYVKNGGNLLVQYNNNNGLVTNRIGPFPFRIVNVRVTDENAPVTILDPADPVLNYPNKITDQDFKGWIQERGIYFATDIDPKYRTILQLNDPNEQPNKGSLLVADYGKGRFVYTSLVFFRELPAGVPGAYRLFINLISKAKK